MLARRTVGALLAEHEHIEIDFPSLGSRHDQDPEPDASVADEQEEDDFSWLAMAFADEDEPDVTELARDEDDDTDVEHPSPEDIEAIASALDDGSSHDAPPTARRAADENATEVQPTAADVPPTAADVQPTATDVQPTSATDEQLRPPPSSDSLDEPIDEHWTAADLAADLSAVITDAPEVEIVSAFEADDIDPLDPLDLDLDEVLDLDDVVSQLSVDSLEELTLIGGADQPAVGEPTSATTAPDTAHSSPSDEAPSGHEARELDQSAGGRASAGGAPEEDAPVKSPPTLGKGAPIAERSEPGEPDEPVERDASETDENAAAEEPGPPRRSGLREELLGTFSQLYGKR